jgi:hypothetical protein
MPVAFSQRKPVPAFPENCFKGNALPWQERRRQAHMGGGEPRVKKKPGSERPRARGKLTSGLPKML